MDLTPKAKSTKAKQEGPDETKRLPHSKENHQQNEKAAYAIGEDICKPHYPMGVNIQNIQGTSITQRQKTANKLTKK